MVLPGLAVDNPGSVAAIALPECRGSHGIVFRVSTVGPLQDLGHAGPLPCESVAFEPKSVASLPVGGQSPRGLVDVSWGRSLRSVNGLVFHVRFRSGVFSIHVEAQAIQASRWFWRSGAGGPRQLCPRAGSGARAGPRPGLPRRRRLRSAAGPVSSAWRWRWWSPPVRCRGGGHGQRGHEAARS